MDLSAKQQQRFALAVLASALVLILCGWLIGRSGGPDIDAARAKGAAAGAKSGHKQGIRQGFASGYRKGYRTSYKAAYERAKRGD